MASLRKSVLITGCSAGGIGSALAEAFHEKDYHVFATLRTPSKISQTLSDAGNVSVLQLDVLSSESIAAAVESVKTTTGGKLDVLVNNSGQNLFAPALDTPIDEGKKLFDLNFWAPYLMVQAFAPLLIAAKGCIVNNTSANAQLPMPFMSKLSMCLQLLPVAKSPGIYNCSKAALFQASETWRYELQPFGVRTITLTTCAVKTHRLGSTPRVVELPETSRYFGVRDFIHHLASGQLQAGAISPKQYATKVVGYVEKGTVGEVWAGTNAAVGQWAWWLSPRIIRVGLRS